MTASPARTNFETIVDLRRTEAGYRTQLTQDWTQGRSTFGGLIAAMAIAALRRETEDRRPLRSLDIAFIGPVGAGPVDVTTEVLREGRSATHAAATVSFGGEVSARAHAVFGNPRPSSIERSLPAPNPSQPPDAVPPLPFIPGITPTFTQHFEYLMCEGDMPFSGSSRATMGGYVRLKSTDNPQPTVETVVAMTDAWPAPTMPMGTRPFPASTARMSVQLLQPVPEAGPEGPPRFWFHSECIAAAAGYATVVGRLYADQTPVAWMEQLVTVFDQ